MLREGRAWTASRIAGWVAANPRRERLFVRAGRIADRRSYLLGTLYTHTREQLVGRLRATGDVYRTIQCGPLSLALDVTDQTAHLEYFYGVAHRYEPALVDYLVAHLRPGDVYLDVGANIGYFSAIAARLVAPSGRVVAFEPNPEARASLSRLLAANALETLVDVDASALTDCVGVGQLHLTGDTVLSTLEPDKSPLRATYVFDRSIDVSLTTLDAWLASRPDIAARVSVIKIDVEGAEDRVLAGMDGLLRRDGDLRVIIETTAGGEADRRMAARGFTARLIDVWDGAFGNYAYERSGGGNTDIR